MITILVKLEDWPEVGQEEIKIINIDEFNLYVNVNRYY